MKVDLNQVEEAAKELYIRALKRLPPDVKDKLAKIGMMPVGSTPSDFASEISTELKTWGEVVKNRHLKQN